MNVRLASFAEFRFVSLFSHANAINQLCETRNVAKHGVNFANYITRFAGNSREL